MGDEAVCTESCPAHVFTDFSHCELSAQVYYYAQDVDIDSIERKLELSAGVEKIQLLNELSRYHHSRDHGKSLAAAREAYDLAKKLAIPGVLLNPPSFWEKPIIIWGNIPGLSVMH
ncbi:MAG: hypothetical protein U5Q03_06090 [Bacteroidota bacterium]|nr:hypothetical protein [Bacteroidota bacterium]